MPRISEDLPRTHSTLSSNRDIQFRGPSQVSSCPSHGILSPAQSFSQITTFLLGESFPNRLELSPGNIPLFEIHSQVSTFSQSVWEPPLRVRASPR